MAEYSGYVIIFDEEQRAELLKMQSRQEELWCRKYSDALSALDWEIGDNEFCIISFGGKSFDAACLAKRGKKVATAKYRVEFSAFVNLDSLAINEVENLLPSSVRQYFTRTMSGRGSRVPVTTWKEMINSIKNLRSSISAELDWLDQLRLASKRASLGPDAETVALEKDAVGVAQDIFDPSSELRKNTLSKWVPPEGPLPPFLKNADGIVLLEEQMLAIDANYFPESTQNSTYFGRRFVIGRRKLDVAYINRTSLEKTLGVDLLYYNHDFNSYTVIQYKRMKKERISDSQPEGYVFRPSTDDNFKRELDRMQEFRRDFADSWPPPRSPHLYRLCGDGFFFKFCPAVQLVPLNPDLIKGMYIPREYLESLLLSEETDGVRGGKVINFENVKRYLSNTEFTALVREGWVGTRGVTTGQITKLAQIAFTGQRAVIIARSASS